MSSVGSASDRNREDEVRRQRDAYQAREGEETKQHSQEIRTLNEAHEAEMDKLRMAHEREMDDIRQKTRDAITSRDMRYQKEIEDLRDMYQKQMTRSAQDADSRIGRFQETSKAEMDKSRQISDQQRTALQRSYESQLADAESQHLEHAGDARAKAQADLASTKERMNKSNNDERKLLAHERDERLGELRDQFAALRRSKDEQLRAQERQSDSQSKRVQSNFEGLIDGERADSRAAQDNQREGFSRGLEQNRDRYLRALEANSQALSSSQDGLQRTADERINGRLRSIEGDYQRLQGDAMRARMQSDEQKARELGDAREEFRKNAEVYERQRRDIVDVSNKKNHDDLARAQKASEEALHGTTVYYQDRSVTQEARAGERLAAQKLDSDKEKAHAEEMSATHIEKLRADKELDQGRMRSYIESSTSAMRENFDSTLREMRLRNQQEQQKLFAQFAQTSADADKKTQEKLAETQLRYETQMAEINERHQKEMKDFATQADRRLRETQGKDAQETQAQVAQLQYRISKNEELHKKDMLDMQRKHEEALANLTKSRQS